MGESAPGPTGLTWALERSDTRHAQAERPPTERSGARAGFQQVSPGALRGTQWWDAAGAARSGLATPAPEVTGHPGVTESSAEQTRFCVKSREGDKGVKPLETAQHDRVVQRTSVHACLCLSSVAGTSRLSSGRWSCRRASAISLQLHGPSGPTSYQPTSHRAEWSRTERSRKQEPARRCRDRVVQTERPGRQASALTSSGQVAMYRNS